MTEADKSLIALREKIKEDLTFFYPSYNGVKGFEGTGDIFFVRQKPARGTFPTRKDEFFYKVLKEKGFANAHITDLIKTRGKVIPKVAKDELDLNWSLFEEEIKRLNPKLIVGMGNDVYERLSKKK